MTYKVIASSSKGNAVLINGDILIDCGVAFGKLNSKINIKKLSSILISHTHGDHMKIGTIKKILRLNRFVKIYGNKEVIDALIKHGIKAEELKLGFVDFYINNKDEEIQIKPVALYHDVPTFGFRIKIEARIFKDLKVEVKQTKIFYATDTSTLENIKAKDYDYYFIETNYTEDEMKSFDKNRVANTHLSKEQAEAFYITNKGENSELIRLHKSSRNY